jgi:hypothetical protein
LPPGKQTVVVSTAESERIVELVTTDGSIDFVGFTSSIGMSTMRVGTLRKLDQSEGRAAVTQARMARGIS